jgi:hypothetical protein
VPHAHQYQSIDKQQRPHRASSARNLAGREIVASAFNVIAAS